MNFIVKAVIIQNNCLLLVHEKDSSNWSLPGGRLKNGEGLIKCLCREAGEEMGGVSLKDIRHYGDFSDEDRYVRVCLAEISEGYPHPTNEISRIIWTSRLREYKMSDLTREIIDSLVQDGLIYR
jgi:ADP-ribose pyrophosphatase YjhB (NUDIX family)